MSEQSGFSPEEAELLALHKSLDGQSVPWGLLTREQYLEKQKAWRGLSATISWPVSPWAVFDLKETKDLIRQVRGIMSVTSGMAAFDGPMWHPPEEEEVV